MSVVCPMGCRRPRQKSRRRRSISDQNGHPLGTTTLYYSPSCHAIWGYASFNTTHGSFQICATDINDISQFPQCVSYGATFYGANSTMQALRVNDNGYATTFVNAPTLGSGSSPVFKRTF